jgi:hypothetical protein
MRTAWGASSPLAWLVLTRAGEDDGGRGGGHPQRRDWHWSPLELGFLTIGLTVDLDEVPGENLGEKTIARWNFLPNA